MLKFIPAALLCVALAVIGYGVTHGEARSALTFAGFIAAIFAIFGRAALKFRK